MKKTEMKVVGKIGMEIAKLMVFWEAVVPWGSDILEYDWNWNSGLVELILIAAVTLAGYSCVTRVKEHISELKVVKEERKNLKKGKGAKPASPSLFAGYL